MTRLHDLWRRARRPDAAADGDLLRRFDRAGDEAAFAELVARYGPVVYGACRRLLADPADVEDAFQATFLVLVTRAGSLSGEGLGPWLYRVAVLTARNLRRRNARRAAGSLSPQFPAPAPPSVDLRLDLDAALMALPARYRTPVVLCYLRGWSRREAALHLGCPEGTLSARLSRAMVKLRRRLAGADPVVVLAAAGVCAPAATADAAVRAAVLFHASSRSAAALTPAVADLTRGVLRMFWWKKVVAAGLVVVSLAVAGLGVGLTGAAAQQPNAVEDLRAKQKALEAQLQQKKAEQQKLEAEKAELEEMIRREAAREPYVLVIAADGGTYESARVQVQEYVADSTNGSLRPAGTVTLDYTFLPKYLARVRLDRTAPEKLVLRIDAKGDRYANEIRAIEGYCRKAGFSKFELASSSTAPPKSDVRGSVSPSHVIAATDRLRVEVYVRNASADSKGDLRSLQPQSSMGEYQVGPDGTIFLGMSGPVMVAGLTLEQAVVAVGKFLEGKDDVRRQLKVSDRLLVVVDAVSSKPQAKPTAKGFREPDRQSYKIEPPDILKIEAYVRRIPANAATDANGVLLELPVSPVRSGQHIVRPDGTVSLGKYGAVSVTGLTIPEATAAVRKHLSEQKDVFRREPGTSESLVVVIDVLAFNSKVFYVIADGNGTGEQVFRMPATGNETVLDAVSNVNGLMAGGEKRNVWVARPSPTPGEQPQILPVDWAGITQHGLTQTNYQILPGDRVYVKRSDIAAGP